MCAITFMPHTHMVYMNVINATLVSCTYLYDDDVQGNKSLTGEIEQQDQVLLYQAGELANQYPKLSTL